MSSLGQELHKNWSLIFDDSLRLSDLVRWLIVLLYLMLLVFMTVTSARTPPMDLFELSWRSRGVQLLLVGAAGLFVLRVIRREAKQKHKDSGFSATQIAIALDGSAVLPEKEYISTTQGLAGKPDALVNENGKIIPIERKPLAKKLRDRYVVQLLVYMRLVEEFEGHRPPHGYLILGPSCRRVKVDNSESKQKWVEGFIKEMRRILDGAEPRPTPHPSKCAKCDVKHRCYARIDKDRDSTVI